MSKERMGTKVWLPCTVAPGPFSNERAVTINVGDRYWSGFVNIGLLKTKVEEGEDQVLANILCSTEKTFQASILARRFEGPFLKEVRANTGKAWSNDTVEAGY